MMNELNNFVKLRNLGFNIHLMRAAFRRITKIQDFDHAEGKVKYISGISLNKIPNDNKSTKGKNIWGRYWIKPDQTGKEVERADPINEGHTPNLFPNLMILILNMCMIVYQRSIY